MHNPMTQACQTYGSTYGLLMAKRWRTLNPVPSTQYYLLVTLVFWAVVTSKSNRLVPNARASAIGLGVES